MTSATGTPSNSVLASIFVLSLLLMFLIPFTLCVARRARSRRPCDTLFLRRRSRLFSQRKPKPAAVKRVNDTDSQWGRAAAAQASPVALVRACVAG